MKPKWEEERNMDYHNHEAEKIQQSVFKLLVSKTFKKYGVDVLKAISEEEKKKLRETIEHLKAQTDNFLNSKKRYTESTNNQSNPQQGGLETSNEPESSAIKYRRRRFKK
jgi:hypothetical protein